MKFFFTALKCVLVDWIMIGLANDKYVKLYSKYSKLHKNDMSEYSDTNM